MEKPVVSIRYGETEKFEDFVCLYKDTNEWLDLVGEILQNPQEYTKETKAIHQFIKSNTWNARVKQIVKKIQL